VLRDPAMDDLPAAPPPAARPPRALKRRVLVGALAALAAFVVYLWAGLPSRDEVRSLSRRNPGKTGVMLQREAEARAKGRKPRFVQSWVPIGRVSRHLIHAVVAAEDPNFFGHEGVDWDAVKESLEHDVRKRSFARGGSTITQQLAKNLFFTTYKSVVRKVREVVVARWLEEDLTKARILEIYLNVIEWGDGVYGCEAGARRYYGKPAAALDEFEAAGLAAMIPSPRRINPVVNPARLARAQRRVLWLMARLGYTRRGVGDLGAEPPPEPVDDAEVEADTEPPLPEPEAPPASEPMGEPAAPTAEPQPSPSVTHEPTPFALPDPTPYGTPEPRPSPETTPTPTPGQ
jgi:monofunctional biosynthetic peptidoglycan transglycosylase